MPDTSNDVTTRVNDSISAAPRQRTPRSDAAGAVSSVRRRDVARTRTPRIGRDAANSSRNADSVPGGGLRRRNSLRPKSVSADVNRRRFGFQHFSRVRVPSMSGMSAGAVRQTMTTGAFTRTRAGAKRHSACARRSLARLSTARGCSAGQVCLSYLPGPRTSLGRPAAALRFQQRRMRCRDGDQTDLPRLRSRGAVDRSRGRVSTNSAGHPPQAWQSRLRTADRRLHDRCGLPVVRRRGRRSVSAGGCAAPARNRPGREAGFEPPMRCERRRSRNIPQRGGSPGQLPAEDRVVPRTGDQRPRHRS
jgi:hypothetical protein